MAMKLFPNLLQKFGKTNDGKVLLLKDFTVIFVQFLLILSVDKLQQNDRGIIVRVILSIKSAFFMEIIDNY